MQNDDGTLRWLASGTSEPKAESRLELANLALELAVERVWFHVEGGSLPLARIIHGPIQ